MGFWLLVTEAVVADFMFTVLVDRPGPPVLVTVTVREAELFMDAEGLEPQFAVMALFGLWGEAAGGGSCLAPFLHGVCS